MNGLQSAEVPTVDFWQMSAGIFRVGPELGHLAQYPASNLRQDNISWSAAGICSGKSWRAALIEIVEVHSGRSCLITCAIATPVWS